MSRRNWSYDKLRWTVIKHYENGWVQRAAAFAQIHDASMWIEWRMERNKRLTRCDIWDNLKWRNHKTVQKVPPLPVSDGLDMFT